MRASMEIENLLDDAVDEFVLGTTQADTLVKHMFDLMALDTALANYFHPRGQMLFHFTIKCHYLLHIAMKAREINPRLGWCYQGEDWMQKAKHLLQACQKGNKPDRALNEAMKKYCYAITFQMTRRTDIWR